MDKTKFISDAIKGHLAAGARAEEARAMAHREWEEHERRVAGKPPLPPLPPRHTATTAAAEIVPRDDGVRRLSAALFGMIDLLSDDSLTGDELRDTCARAQSIVAAADSLIKLSAVQIQAARLRADGVPVAGLLESK